MLSYVSKLKPNSRMPQYTLLAVSLLGSGTLMMEYALHSPFKEQVAQEIQSTYQTAESADPATQITFKDLSPVTPENQHEELLWLARCIYSETKRPIEQLYVAWVIRNRVESQYRGKTSYKSVVLDPYQFSAFNAASYSRSRYAGLDASNDRPGWQQALRIAQYVMDAPAQNRPFSLLTRHFYSEQSMNTSRPPQWSQNFQPIRMTEHQIDGSRFRFFTGIL